MSSAATSGMKEWTERIILNLLFLNFIQAYKDYLWLMETTEQMLEKVSIATNGTTTVYC